MAYIFISSSRADLELARSVRVRLHNEGLTTWLDDTGTSLESQEVAMLTRYVIGTIDAVLAIGTGVSAELEVAHQLGKPIYYLDPNSDLNRLIVELKRIRQTSEPLPLIPEPLDMSPVEALESTLERSRLPLGLIVFGVVIVVLIAVFLFIRSQNDSGEETPTAAAVVELTPAPTATQVATVVVETMTLPIVDTATPVEPSVLLPPTQTKTPTAVPSSTAERVEILTVTNTITESLTPTATFTPTDTATVTASPTHLPTETPTASPTPLSSATTTPSPSWTWTPTPTSAFPALDATLIPGGTENTLWTPIERQINDLAMVYVPGGCFTMIGGGAGVESLCVEPFWISKTEITTRQYGDCVQSGPCTPPTTPSSRTRQEYFGNSSFANFPVIAVNWHQAQDFADWAGGELPSEVQWRYAAQGPSAWLYPWGNNEPDPSLLNYDGLVADVTEVGTYPLGASWVGALDLSGNVWEWTITSADQNNKVVYGGSWNSYVGLVSAASRAANPETDSSFYTGFRVVMDAALVQ